MGGGVCLLARGGALHGMQDLVALIDAGTQLLLAREADGVVEMANDASVLEVQLRREVKCECHGGITGVGHVGSGASGRRDKEDASPPERNLSMAVSLRPRGITSGYWQVFS
jgi:hypothetical protein